MVDDSNKELPYQVTLNGDGLALDKSITLETAMLVMEVVMSGGKKAMHPINANNASPNNTQSKTGVTTQQTIAEFLRSCEAVRNPDIITAIAYYMRSNENLDTFNKDDIRSRFRTARIPLPANFSRDFNKTLNSAWISEDESGAGSYFLTQMGEDAFNDGFAGDYKRPSSGKQKSNSENKKKSSLTKATRSNPKLLKDLDLSGKDDALSLVEFYEQHPANSDLKRNVVFAHYISEFLKISPVTEDHVLTCYHHLGLALPVSMESSLKNSNATARGGYLMSSNPKDVQLSMQGHNLIRELRQANKN